MILIPLSWPRCWRSSFEHYPRVTSQENPLVGSSIEGPVLPGAILVLQTAWRIRCVAARGAALSVPSATAPRSRRRSGNSARRRQPEHSPRPTVVEHEDGTSCGEPEHSSPHHNVLLCYNDQLP